MKPNGGPAFPRASGPEPRVNETVEYNDGMSLRDWLAGRQSWPNDEQMRFIRQRENDSVDADKAHRYQHRTTAALVAEWRYEQADAMLAERAKDV